jgi:Arc/MetJ-type ribon-helix-helix transcriptional regulator
MPTLKKYYYGNTFMVYTETVPAKLTHKLLEEMDELVKEGWYANRSELLRDAVRELIRKLKLQRLEAAIKEDIQWGLHGD